MKIIVTGMMGAGTLEAKIEPISRLEKVSEILFVRKKPGKSIPKTKYIIPPLVDKLSFLHPMVTPFTLLLTVLRKKTNLIISYHIVPYGFFAAFIGRITRTPYIVAQTGLLIQELSKKWYFKKLLYWIFKNSLQVNCPGVPSVLFWQDTFPTIGEKFVVLHSTIDTNKYVPSHGVKKEYDYIFLGRLDPIKRIDMIIDAFNMMIHSNKFDTLPTMLIVGSGPEEEKLKTKTKSYNLEELIHFVGFVVNPVDFLHKSKFLVMASYTEGMPTAMMQAMACELVPISNLTGNISDLIEDNVTGLVHHATIESIYNSMLLAYNLEPNTYASIGIAAKEKILENHSYLVASKEWDRIIDNILFLKKDDKEFN